MDHRAGGSSRRCLTPSNMFRLGYTIKAKRVASSASVAALFLHRAQSMLHTASRYKFNYNQSPPMPVALLSYSKLQTPSLYHRTPPNSSSCSLFPEAAHVLRATQCIALLLPALSRPQPQQRTDNVAQTMWHAVHCGETTPGMLSGVVSCGVWCVALVWCVVWW